MRRLPDELLEQWWAPLRDDAAVRAETGAFLKAIKPAELVDVATRLPRYQGRVLLTWAPRDRFFKIEHGRRLAALFSDSELLEVPDSRTFVPWDQPQLLAGLIAGELPMPAGDRRRRALQRADPLVCEGRRSAPSNRGRTSPIDAAPQRGGAICRSAAFGLAARTPRRSSCPPGRGGTLIARSSPRTASSVAAFMRRLDRVAKARWP